MADRIPVVLPPLKDLITDVSQLRYHVKEIVKYLTTAIESVIVGDVDPVNGWKIWNNLRSHRRALPAYDLREPAVDPALTEMDFRGDVSKEIYEAILTECQLIVIRAWRCAREQECVPQPQPEVASIADTVNALDALIIAIDAKLPASSPADRDYGDPPATNQSTDQDDDADNLNGEKPVALPSTAMRLSHARMLRLEHPDWSKRKIAKETGLNHGQLSRDEIFQRLDQTVSGQPSDLPRGFKDGSTGEIEAYE